MEVSDEGQITGAEFGSLELVSPEQIEAGELACINLRYIAGSAGLARGGTLTIWTDSDSDAHRRSGLYYLEVYVNPLCICWEPCAIRLHSVLAPNRGAPRV